MFRIFQDDSKEWQAEKVISVPNQKVQGWVLPEMPALTTDIVISMDDKFLYTSNWLQGDIRQYDIRDTRNPKQVGQVTTLVFMVVGMGAGSQLFNQIVQRKISKLNVLPPIFEVFLHLPGF